MRRPDPGVTPGRGRRLPRLISERLRVDSLVRGSLNLMLVTVITSIFGAGYWAVAARLFPASGVGEAATLISGFTLVSTLSTVGTQSFVVARLPERRHNGGWSRTVLAALITTGIASLVGGVLLVAAGHFATGTLNVFARDLGLAALAVSGVLVTTWMTLLDFVATAERATGTAVTRNLVVAVLKLALLPVVVAVGLAGAQGLALAWVAASVIGICAGIRLFDRYGQRLRLARAGLMEEIKASLRPSFGHYLINLGNQVPHAALPLLVAARLGAEETAWFYVTWRLCGLFFMVSAWVSVALFAEGSNERHRLADQVRRSAVMTAVLLIPLIVVFLAAGRPLLGIFGSDYQENGFMLLVVLVLAAAFDAVTNIYVAVLRVTQRIRACILLTDGMALAILILALPLMDAYGVTGAGLAWLGARVLGSAWVALDVVRRRSPVPVSS